MSDSFAKFFKNPSKHLKPQNPTTKPKNQDNNKEEQKSKLKEKIEQKTIKKQHKSEFNEMQNRIDSHMKGSKFRWINEQLYTTDSKKSFDLIKKDPKVFTDYHEGYSQMVSKWPKNPLDLIIKELSKDSYKNKTIIDLGCGTGKLGKSLENTGRKVLSYDFAAVNPWITVCDIANLPLKNNEVDVAVFCLSLMGTNYLDFIGEAYRCLKQEYFYLANLKRGILIIAEVMSRINDLKRLVDGVCYIGFESIKVVFFIFSKENKAKCEDYFVIMMLRKTGKQKKSIKMLKFEEQKDGPLLQPCYYKKR